MATIKWEIEYQDYGSTDEKSAYYLIRLTIVDSRIVDRKNVAKFEQPFPSDNVWEVMSIRDALKSNKFQLEVRGLD